MKERIILNGEGQKGWYAFIPDEPEIFGHIIVTVPSPHVQNIENVAPTNYAMIHDMAEGVTLASSHLKKIGEEVKRVYVLMLGESPIVHMHFHLIPRYEFKSNEELSTWSKRINLSRGDTRWNEFYNEPTLNFSISKGFRYTGEVERTYNESKAMIGRKPDYELIIEMANQIKKL